jgi:hypothetical protein
VKLFFISSLISFLFNLLSFSQVPDHWENIADATDSWKYIIPSSELPVVWTNPDFDDSDWSSGPGGFGYGDNDDNTLLPLGTISVFIRKNFVLNDASALLSAILYIDYDDGFVAYLNGTEIARANLGVADIRPAFNKTASRVVEPAFVTGAIAPRFIIDTKKLSASLKNGINTLAIQVHNSQVSSPDLSSTAYLFGGFRNPATGFRSPPDWFIAPPVITSHLPIIVIDTWDGYIPNEPKIDAWIKIINNGPGRINNLNDAGTDFEGNIGIELRGQSSQMFPKKGYGFETRNPLKQDSSVVLLGMPEESDWILSAPYSDKTMMRNSLTYYLGNRMGRWQPHSQWCELYLNEDYQGVYLMMEKIKRDKDRINIDKLLPTELAGDSLTGGYIVKVDKLDGLSTNDYFRTYPISFSTARHYDFTYVYPKATEIMPAQKTYIKDFLTDLENALNGTDFKDPITGFRAYMDESSFAEYQIIQELSNNVDGYRYSTFFYKENDLDGGKLIAGPLWDFDLCYGNVDYSSRNLATDQWLYTHYGPNEGYPMHWWARLMQDPDYTNLVKWRYSNLRSGPLNTDSVFAYLDLNQSLLGSAIERNFARWPILDQYIWPNSYIGYTYENEMDFLKTWLSDRLTWMDSKWLVPLNKNDIAIPNPAFSVFPNPFRNRLTLSVPVKNHDEISVEIINLQGQKMLTRFYQPDNTIQTEIRVENINLNPGIYLLKVQQSGQLISYSKVICTHVN